MQTESQPAQSPSIPNDLPETGMEKSETVQPRVRAAIEVKDPAPASWSQQRIWFIDQLESQTRAYHLQLTFDLRGRLNRQALQKAFNVLIERHEALRTTFLNREGRLFQQIAPRVEFRVREVDLRALSHDEREMTIREQVRAELDDPFDLRRGPLIRGKLIQATEETYVLCISMHHIISDGWSLGVLQREISQLYTANVNGECAPPPPLRIQYSDYAHWQLAAFEAGEYSTQLEWWREHLRGVATQLELPTDRIRPATQSYRGSAIEFSLGEALSARIRALARRHGMSVFMVLLSGWAVLLAKLSRQQDIVIGTPVANRQHEGIEGVIGPFVNTIPIRVH